MNAVLAYVSDSDLRFSGRVRRWRLPRWFLLWMLWATRLGDGWLWLGVGMALLAHGGRANRMLAACALAVAAANVVLVVLKRRFRRARPCDVFPHPLAQVPTPRRFPSDRFSFPSGHALNAFAVSSVLALCCPWLAPALALVAVSVAASRVVLGLHYVSDVVAGGVFGVILGGLAYVLILG